MENAVSRSFIKSLGSTAALLAYPLGAAIKLADTMRIGDRRYKHTETRTLMGTQVSIVTLHLSKDAARHAAELGFLEIERLSAIFDRRQSATPVSYLNETGRLSDVAPELLEVMEKAGSFYRRSKGAFDPSVLPILDVLKSGRDAQGRLRVSQRELDNAMALVGFDSVEVADSGISFNKSSMSITLDGIGRGYIVDRASDILAANGVENHLIIAGGDIRACGERSPGQPWIVAINAPSGKRTFPAVIRLKDIAVATSGGAEFYFDAEESRYHIPNSDDVLSSSKRGVHGHNVSVVAPTVMEADALSTSGFVMSPVEALSFINAQEESECLIFSSAELRMFSRNWENQVRV